MNTARRIQLGLAVLLLAVGTGLYGWVVYDETVSGKGAARKVEAPGSASFPLDEDGTWSIYWEYDGAPPSRINPMPMPELACTVTDAHDVPLPVRAASRNSYRIGAMTGVEMLEFDARGVGEHRFECTLKEPYPRLPVLTLNVGKSIVGRSVRAVALPSLVYLAAMGLAAFLLVRALRPRRH